jgi:hypothetical protein
LNLAAIPPTTDFDALPFAAESIITAGPSTAASYHSPFMTPAIPSASLSPAWNAPVYSQHSHSDVSTWSTPQSIANFNHPPQLAVSSPDYFAYSPPQTAYSPRQTQSYGPIRATYPPYQQSYGPASGSLSTSSSSGYSSYGAPTDHPQWMSSVSPPQFSPPLNNQWPYSGPP